MFDFLYATLPISFRTYLESNLRGTRPGSVPRATLLACCLLRAHLRPSVTVNQCLQSDSQLPRRWPPLGYRLDTIFPLREQPPLEDFTGATRSEISSTGIVVRTREISTTMSDRLTHRIYL